MIGQLTSNYETGLKIKEKIKELKIVIHSEYVSYVGGYKQITYMYTDEISKEEHKKKMLNNGLSLVDSQDYMHIYHSFYDTDERNDSMLIPCQIYQIKIKNSLS